MATGQVSTPVAQPQPGHQQQFCVRWNSYQSNLQNAFPKLLTSEHFVDVTLACESEMIKCHKVVLSACSTYFEKLLVQNPCQHPIIFMKDMRFAEMQALVDFMYKGEVNVTQDELPSLLRSAEALQIRGLCGSDQLLSQHYLSGAQTNGSVGSPAQTVEKKETNTTCSNGEIKEPQKIENGRVDFIKREGTIKRECVEQEGGESAEDCKEEFDNDDSYYDQDGLDMETDFLEQDEEDITQPGTSGAGGGLDKTPEFAIANVSCQYSSDGSPGGGIPSARRIRRSEAELRRAAECITRGQTFQTVSDQFNIPISTIRFYMARKGILPRRKRGRACSAPGGQMMSPPVGAGHGAPLTPSGGSGSNVGGNIGGGFHGTPGNTSPVGPPYHIVHYKLPALGAKLK